MYSKIFLNGTIIDGSGAKAYQGDIAIENDKVVEIGNLKKAKAEEIIDISGKYITPGFVDIQSHSDVYWTIFDNPRQDSLVAQGITTILMGSCGGSLAPLLSRGALLSVQKWHNLEGSNFSWMTFREYLDVIERKNLGLNVASLVGYATLRRGMVQDEVRSVTREENYILAKALKQALEEGAFGMSTGLSYAHEAIIAENELANLARIVQDHNGLFSVHLRSEAAELTESVAEALDLVNKTDVNLKISHFKARDSANWHLLPHALSLIEDNYQKKGKVLFDLYPYETMWNVLYTYLPKWSYEGGREVMLKNLKDPHQRRKILGYLMSKETDYANIFIASTTMPINVNGKKIGALAASQDISSEEAILSVIEHGGSEILVFDRNLDGKQVESLLAHPLSMISTDGAGFSIDTRGKIVHPRCFGAMPKFLSLAIEKKLLPIEEAVKKITYTPAKKIGLVRRGRIAVDNFADLVVFDKTINSKATYENPYQYPVGIEMVLVNGNFSFRAGEFFDKYNGRVLRRK